MRYLGGWYGGTWLDRMMSDMAGGIFDAAWLVANFDNLNPANTFWTKQYNVWTNPEQEKDRYLQFEKWWGDFVLLRGEEMQWMVDNLFISNKFSTGQLVTSDGIRLRGQDADRLLLFAWRQHHAAAAGSRLDSRQLPKRG
jgi:poly(3-hydroxyalkanoate) synthetase